MSQQRSSDILGSTNDSLKARYLSVRTVEQAIEFRDDLQVLIDSVPGHWCLPAAREYLHLMNNRIHDHNRSMGPEGDMPRILLAGLAMSGMCASTDGRIGINSDDCDAAIAIADMLLRKMKGEPS